MYGREPQIMDTFKEFSKFIQNVNSQDVASYKDVFFKKIDTISEIIDSSPNGEELKEKFFSLCSALDDSIMHQRTRTKPLGYAGDFLLIDWIYTRRTSDSPHGKFFDNLFHSFEAAQSVRNRKEFFIKKCIEITKNATEPFNVLDIGCGSCRDALEAFESVDSWENLYFQCVDQEIEAIQYARELFRNKPYSSHVVFEQANVFFLKKDKTYPLIWSAGLFDYLDDRTIRVLLKKLWRIVPQGGEIIFGNFSPKNPTKKGMELVGKWFLIHRTAEQLLDICQNSGLDYSKIEIESEPQGINLFCTIQK